MTTGQDNVAIGGNAGEVLTSGSNNTFVGNGAYATVPAVTNATAIGANARVDLSNAMVLGSVAGVNLATSTVNVGIGTTAPQARLDIVTTGHEAGAAITLMRAGANGIVEDAPLQLRAARGPRTAPTPVLSGDKLGTMLFTGFNGTQFPNEAGARIVAVATEGHTVSGAGTRLHFDTTTTGGTSIATRMVIDDDGRVGINRSNPFELLHVGGDVRIGASGATGCLKNASGVAIIGVCSSDVRFKRDITPFPATLARLTALRPVHYFWRAEEFPAKGFGHEQAYGLIAQDVEAVLPELVSTDERGFKAVDYAKRPLLAIQALTELTRRHEALQQAHDALRTSVEARLAALETALRVAHALT